MKFSGECENRQIDMGDKDLTPMELMLLSVVGCTLFDVVYALKKFREPIDGLDVSITGERRDTDPRYFTKLRLEYKVTGDLNERKVKRAIRLSQDKYCSALAQMKKSGVEVEWRYEILESST
ncbi:MAG: OsmC family protein [Euryarchaeota archaeon]|nr:OsmC family protein [Euryarchaeota archaeon]